MYQENPSKKKHKKTIKSITLLVSLLLLITAGIGGTVAFLMDSADPIENRFDPSELITTIIEDWNGKTKENVKIKNAGNTEAWIRAAVVITWQDENGNVYGQTPVAGTDYEITWNLSADGWVNGSDGFYYWTNPVDPEKDDSGNVIESNAESCLTGVLITKCTPKDTAPDGYYLTVDIIGSGIQSNPDRVFNTEWSGSGYVVQTDSDGNSVKLIKGGASDG